MASRTAEPQRDSITPQTSVALAVLLAVVVPMMVGTLYIGRQLQRLDTLQETQTVMKDELRHDIRELQGEMQSIRVLLMQPPRTPERR